MSLAYFRAAVAARARAPRGARDRPPRAVGHRASARAWRTGPRAASARPGPESLRKGRRHRPLGEPPSPRAAAIPTPGALASRATASARGTTAPRLRLSRDRLRAVSRASESSPESSSPPSANDAASRGGRSLAAAKAAAKAAAAVTAKRLKAAVDWTTYVTRDSVARNVTGWVREKVKALLGEDEPSLVEFVSDALASKPASAAKLVALLEPMLGDETGPFVDELWRVLARETTERPDA